MTSVHVFVLSVVILCLELALLGPTTMLVRIRRGVWLNPEDAARLGGSVSDAEHPDVARWLRVHRNHLENCVPFFALGALWVSLDLWPSLGMGLFATFTAARVIYPLLYAMRVGHPRTAAFAVAWVVQLVLAGGLVWHVLSPSRA